MPTESGRKRQKSREVSLGVTDTTQKTRGRQRRNLGRKTMEMDFSRLECLEKKIISKSVVYATLNDRVYEAKLFQIFN